MASFRQSQGVLTEEWTASSGAGGLVLWTCRGLCLNTSAAWTVLQKYAVYKVRFIPIPHRAALDAVSLDGSSIYVGTIDVRQGPICAANTAPACRVTNCVKLGPVTYSSVAPKQIVGSYVGYEIVAFAVSFQYLGVY
jgi:hypothetical protein